MRASAREWWRPRPACGRGRRHRSRACARRSSLPRPRCGRVVACHAAALLADLLQRGRKQTDDLREDIEGLLGGAKGVTRKGVAGSADRVLREVDRARRVAGVGPSFPILGYDDLTAAQVNERLAELGPAELRKVRDYEKRNANRKSVLAAVEQKLK